MLQTGKPERIDDYNEAKGRWYRVHYSRVGDARSLLLGIWGKTSLSAKGRNKCCAKARSNTFLLKLSDALRPLAAMPSRSNPLRCACSDHLRVNRAQYYESDTGASSGMPKAEIQRMQPRSQVVAEIRELNLKHLAMDSNFWVGCGVAPGHFCERAIDMRSENYDIEGRHAPHPTAVSVDWKPSPRFFVTF